MDSDHVILPPPSAKNPIPSLPAALRIDNKERFLDILSEDPTGVDNASFRQLLVFGKESLRTLLMRQVLQDPRTKTTKTGKSAKSNKNKNWEDSRFFAVPKTLQNNIVGTRVLLKKKQSQSMVPQRNRTSWKGLGHEEGESDSNTNNMDEDLFQSPDDIFEHVDVITYLVRPWDLDQTMAVINRIKGCALPGSSEKTHKQHHRIVYVPQVTAMCTKILVDHQVWNPNHINSNNCVSVVGLQLDLFPLEPDVLSLEYEDGVLDAGSVGGCPSEMVETSARALAKLQDVVGRIPRIQSLGAWGEDVLAKLLNNSVDEYWAGQKLNESGETSTTAGDSWQDGDEEEEEKESSNDSGDIHPADVDAGLAMVLVDRRLDMVTPMVTPLTYEGLLDELVGIECSHIEIPEAIINPPDPDDDDNKPSSTNPFDESSSNNPFEEGGTASETTTKVALGVHEGDTLYAEVRDQHVEKFGSFLQDQAIALKESHANFTSKETKKDLDEIEKFVKQIPIFTQSLRSLTNHIHLAELIKAHTEDVSFRDQWNNERAMIEGEHCYDFLEECIYGDHPPYKVLRLLCLQSLASGGIRANKYEQLRQSIVQVYGYEFLPVLHDLETMGWIKKNANFIDNSSRSLFQNLKRNLILIHAEVNTVEPDDVSYVSSGYAPLTVRLVQSAMQGWKTSDKEDVLKDVFQMMALNSSSGASRLLDIRQSQPPRDLSTTLRHQKTKAPFGGTSLGAFGKAHTQSSNQKPTLIVVYLGGITYAEIASLRFLSKKDSFPYHIVVVTTKILNGSKLLQQMGK